MGRPSIQWGLLHGAIAALLVALLLAAGAIYGSSYYLAETENEYLRQRARLDGVARLYRTAENDRSLYSRYVQRFEELERLGVIGDEPRLSWVEALQRINQDLKLPVLRYEIAPQQPLSFERSALNTQIMRVYRSSMRLDAGLLHEVDLVVLIDALRALTSGRFEVRGCDLKLGNPQRGLVLDARTPNLIAACRLDWYTLRIEGVGARNEQDS